MSVGHLDAPGVTDGAKDLGPVLVAWWLIPTNSTNLVVERGRQPGSGRLRCAAVNEQEIQSFVRTVSGEVGEYQFDGLSLGCRGGDHPHAQRQSRNVHADDALGPVGATVGTTLIVEGDAPVRGSSSQVGVDDDHRWPVILSTEGGALQCVQ